ncbi:MAG: energy-coupling factor transporter transmembrane component T [Syntrophales bacterium]
MQNLNFGQFNSAFSPLRHVDPRVKILTVVVLSILIFQATPGVIVMISLFMGLVILISRVSMQELGRALKPIAVFAVLLFLLHLFFTEGRDIFVIPLLPVRITYEGLENGFLVVWQFAALVTAGALLTMTTPPSTLVAALEKLLKPLKIVRVPTQDLAVMVSMALRFVPTFSEEYNRMKTARLARGGDLKGKGLIRKVKTAISIVVPLILSAFRRADDLAAAMEARGYARGPRTTLKELRLTGMDFAVLALMVSFAGLTIVIRFIDF